MNRQLTALGYAVMQAVESSAGVGMMGMSWKRDHLQKLFEEVRRQHDIEYIYLADQSGNIVVSGEAQEVGAALAGAPIAFTSLRADKALKDAESFTRHVIDGMGYGLIALNPRWERLSR